RRNPPGSVDDVEDCLRLEVDRSGPVALLLCRVRPSRNADLWIYYGQHPFIRGCRKRIAACRWLDQGPGRRIRHNPADFGVDSDQPAPVFNLACNQGREVTLSRSPPARLPYLLDQQRFMGKIPYDSFRLGRIFQSQIPEMLPHSGNEVRIATERQDVIPRFRPCADKAAVGLLAWRLRAITGARKYGRS